MGLKALIVEDEYLAREELAYLIANHSQIEVVAAFEDGLEAFKYLQTNKVDIVFLDIQIPSIDGMLLARNIHQFADKPHIVFTTAYKEFAVDAFELEAFDYLLKPISFERFLKAVNKVKKLSSCSTNQVTEDDDYFFVKADKKLIKISYSEILYIEGLKDYVIIKKDTGRVIALQTMKSLDAKLPSSIFKRIHRSYIVNTKRINAIVGNSIEITEGNQVKHLPIGKNYKEDLLAIVTDKKL